MSLDTGIFMVSPRNFTPAAFSMPVVPSNTWMTTTSSEVSSTCPLFWEPSGMVTVASSL